MTKLTKAERADILSASSADGYYAHDISRLCADLDAAEAERDEIKTALGVMGATRERALEVAGSQDELEERIDSMSRERDVALKGWSAAEAARDDAAAQRDRAESELDAERRMRVEAEAAAKRAESERDALKAKLADPRRVVIHETEVVATKEEIATLRSERDKFANWIAMEHRGGPDWACAQCKPPTHGNNMVVEGFVCIRHRAMAIAAECGGVS